MKIKVGDKVRRVGVPTKTGVVTRVSASSSYIHVLRDDGYRGGRSDGSVVWFPEFCEVYEPAEPVTQEKSSHIAGLSPEVIDPDAYRAFMDAL